MQSSHTVFRQPHIELLPQEKILAIQRQHVISLILVFLFHIFTCIVLFLLLVFLIKLRLSFIPQTLYIDIALLTLSFLATLGIFSCMDWYYKFYIVTNKRLIIRHFFKLIGHPYYNEVFIQKGSEFEILRESRNFVTDILDIEDVYIKFHAMEMPEPFIFETPQGPSHIEKALYEAYEE